MILLVLAALWIVVLAPAAVRKCLDRRSAVSIDTFHQQLSLLRRAGGPSVHRLHTVQSTTGLAVGQSGYPAVSSRPTLVLVPPAGVSGATSGGGGLQSPAMAREAEAHRGALVRRRRRDLVLGVGAVLVASGLLGIAVPAAWAVTGLATVALAGYVGLAAYAQMLEADRRMAARPGAAWDVPAWDVLPAVTEERGDDWTGTGGWEYGEYGELPRAAVGG